MCGRPIQNREVTGHIVGDYGTGKTTTMCHLTSLKCADDRFSIAVIMTAEHCSTSKTQPHSVS